LLDRQLTELLTHSDANPTATADAIEAAINPYPPVKLWFEAYLERLESGDRNLAILPGHSTTPAEFELYTCPECDYLWLRESPSQDIPTCPNHPQTVLVPYTPPKS
jgi:hypothetical protein